MNRRDAILILGSLLASPAGALAQPSRVPVVGLLITHAPATDVVVEYLRSGLRQFGYEDGNTIRIEVRTALGEIARMPALAEELVRLPVDVIVVVNEIAVRAATRATRTIPIVLVGFTNDPVEMGWIESYRRPGGNLTGVYAVDLALGVKRLEILRETLPGLARVAVLWDPAFGRRELEELRKAARPMGIELVPVEIRRADDLTAALRSVKQMKVGALLLGWSPVFWVHRQQVGALNLDARLPGICATAQLVQAGFLLSYGSDNVYNWTRAAYFVQRLLTGALAADLPLEQAVRIKLAVNLKTARSLGISVPQSILLRADEVIE